MRLVESSARSIAADVVRLADGSSLDYGFLVYAVDSEANRELISGTAEFGETIDHLGGAAAVERRLQELPSDATATVVGAGLTGIEVADGTNLDSDLSVVTASMTAPRLAADSGLAVRSGVGRPACRPAIFAMSCVGWC